MRKYILFIVFLLGSQPFLEAQNRKEISVSVGMGSFNPIKDTSFSYSHSPIANPTKKCYSLSVEKKSFFTNSTYYNVGAFAFFGEDREKTLSIDGIEKIVPSMELRTYGAVVGLGYNVNLNFADLFFQVNAGGAYVNSLFYTAESSKEYDDWKLRDVRVKRFAGVVIPSVGLDFYLNKSFKIGAVYSYNLFFSNYYSHSANLRLSYVF